MDRSRLLVLPLGARSLSLIVALALLATVVGEVTPSRAGERDSEKVAREVAQK